MCGLLLPRGVKGLGSFSVYFSINNFNQKSFLKTTFELKIKAMISIKLYVNVSDLFLNFAELWKI